MGRQSRRDLPLFSLLHMVLGLFPGTYYFLELILSFKYGGCPFLSKADRKRNYSGTESNVSYQQLQFSSSKAQIKPQAICNDTKKMAELSFGCCL